MSSDSSELTFVRCPSCRSLVPAVSTRCRMCGASLDASAGMEEEEHPKTSGRVRQRTMSSQKDQEMSMTRDLIREESAQAGARKAPAASPVEPEPDEEDDELLADDPLSAYIEEVEVEGEGGDDDDHEDVDEDDFPLEPAPAVSKAAPQREPEPEPEPEPELEPELELEPEPEPDLDLEPESAFDDDDEDEDLAAEVDDFDEEPLDDEQDDEDAPWQKAPVQAPVQAAPVQARSEEPRPVERREEPAAVKSNDQPAEQPRVIVESGRGRQRRGLSFDRPRPAPEAERQPEPVEEAPARKPAEPERAPRPAQPPRKAAEPAPRAEEGSVREPVKPAPREEAPVREAAPVREPVKPAARVEEAAPREPARASRDEDASPSRGTEVSRKIPAVQPAQVRKGRLFGWLVSYLDPSGKGVELREGKFFITRSSLKASDLVLDSESVSTPHAMAMVTAEGGLRVQDLMSERGVFVRRRGDDTYRREEDLLVLENGDWVRFGDLEFLVSLIPYVGVK